VKSIPGGTITSAAGFIAGAARPGLELVDLSESGLAEVGRDLVVLPPSHSTYPLSARTYSINVS